jgi:hypothetical protein
MLPSPNGSSGSTKKVDVQLRDAKERVWHLPGSLQMDLSAIPSVGDEVWVTARTEDNGTFLGIYKVEKRIFSFDVPDRLPSCRLTEVILICELLRSET